MAFDQLKLDNQLCFPVYAASHLIVRSYQPFLDELGITYPQYLVFMVLWENDGLGVNEIAQKLLLKTNTVTPLLKRMETMGFVRRIRSADDERKVRVNLTDAGWSLQEKASCIPERLAAGLSSDDMSVEELLGLRDTLKKLVRLLSLK